MQKSFFALPPLYDKTSKNATIIINNSGNFPKST